MNARPALPIEITAPFSAVPCRVVGDKRLKGAHHRALGVVGLLDCRSLKSKRGGPGCYVSQEQLADLVGVCRSTFCDAVNDLAQWGYLVKEPYTRDRRLQSCRIIYDGHLSPVGIKTPFGAVPRRAIWDDNLTEIHFALLVAIACFDGMSLVRQRGKGCIKQVDQLAVMTGYHRLSVMTGISDLVRYGYLQRAPFARGRATYVIRVVYEDLPGSDTSALQSNSGNLPKTDTMAAGQSSPTLPKSNRSASNGQIISRPMANLTSEICRAKKAKGERDQQGVECIYIKQFNRSEIYDPPVQHRLVDPESDIYLSRAEEVLSERGKIDEWLLRKVAEIASRSDFPAAVTRAIEIINHYRANRHA